MNAAEWTQHARSLGFLDDRWTSVDPLPAWREAALARNMADRIARMTDDAARILPDARAVWLLVMPYRMVDEYPDDVAIVSPYYYTSQRAYHAARSLADALCDAGIGAALAPSLPLKAFTERAGLGAYGRNGLIQHPAYGSNIVLQAIAVDRVPDGAGESGERGEQGSDAQEAAAFERDARACAVQTAAAHSDGDGVPSPQRASHLAAACAACRRCVAACPTQALDGTSAVDVTRCLRAAMFSGAVVDEDMRTPMGRMLLGCDICRRACPQASGKRAARADAPDPLPRECTDPFRLGTLLDPDALRAALPAIKRLIGTNNARERLILPQALIAAGNRGDASLLPLVRQHLDAPDAATRAHAAWAMDRMEHRCDA